MKGSPSMRAGRNWSQPDVVRRGKTKSGIDVIKPRFREIIYQRLVFSFVGK